MSENENKPPSRQTSSVASKQTSSVPLKKETVRVTLKAADAPPAIPSATLPATPPPVVPKPLTPPPTTSVGPPVPAVVPSTIPRPNPSPTIPLKTAGAPTNPGAPTIKLATSKAPIGAPTIALKTANAPLPGAGAPTIPLKTANTPLPGAGAPTIPLKTASSTVPGGEAGKPTALLPKATVALNPPTKPLTPTGAAATQHPTLIAAEEDEDESGVQTFVKILSGVGLVAALVVLGLQLKMAKIWIGARDNDRIDDWTLLIE
jgi:hypothetical protein